MKIEPTLNSEKPAVESYREPAQPESKEAQKGVHSAEQVAYAITELEAAIGDLSESREQDAKLAEIIERYPAAKAYKPIFEQALTLATMIHLRIILDWFEYVGPEHVVEDEGDFLGTGWPAADPYGSKQIAEALLKTSVKGNVKALKAPFAVVLLFDEDSYFDTMRGVFPDETVADSTTGRLLVVNDEIPVIAVTRSDLEGNLMVYMHEKQHLRDQIVETAQTKQVMKALEGNGTLDRKIGRQIIKWNFAESAQELIAKRELLAYFTTVQFQDMMNEVEGDEPVNSELIKDAFGDLVEDFSSPSGAYHESHDPRLRKAPEALDAMIALREMYMKANRPRIADSIVANLLTQFPLKSWPAVARMLESEHSVGPIPSIQEKYIK